MAYKDPLDERARASRRKHYENNKEQYKRRNTEARSERLDILRTAKSVPCADCGISYPPYVMDFDHRDPKTKVKGVRVLASFSTPRLIEEMSKCDVVCSNCHRERTHQQRLAGILPPVGKRVRG